MFRGSILKLTELEKTPGLEMVIDRRRATTESRCVFSCCLRVRGRTRPRWKPARRFETLFFFFFFFTETFITEYKMAPDALLAAEENGRRTKQTREVKGITSLSVDSLAFRSVKSSRPQTLTWPPCLQSRQKFVWMRSRLPQTSCSSHFCRTLHETAF